MWYNIHDIQLYYIVRDYIYAKDIGALFVGTLRPRRLRPWQTHSLYQYSYQENKNTKNNIIFIMYSLSFFCPCRVCMVEHYCPAACVRKILPHKNRKTKTTVHDPNYYMYMYSNSYSLFAYFEQKLYDLWPLNVSLTFDIARVDANFFSVIHMSAYMHKNYWKWDRINN